MPGDPHGGLTACRYYGAHSLEDVSCGRVGCWLVRRPSIECLCFWCREELLQPESGSCMTNTAPTPLIAVPGIRRSSLWKSTMPSASIHLFDSNDPNKPVHSAVATSASWW